MFPTVTGSVQDRDERPKNRGENNRDSWGVRERGGPGGGGVEEESGVKRKKRVSSVVVYGQGRLLVPEPGLAEQSVPG